MSSAVKLIAIFGFLIVITGIIMLTGRKAKSSKEFYAAGGKLPWFVVTGTILATFTGGGTIVGYVGSYFSNGLVWIWVGLGTIVAGIVVATISGKIYNLGKSTVGDILGMRFGENSKLFSGIIIMLADFAVVCGMTAAFAGAVSAATGISPVVCRLIGVAMFVVTAILGGLRGVAITDAIQAAVILVGVITAAILGISYIGGVTPFLQQVDSLKLNPFNGTIPWKTMLGNVVSIIGLNLASQASFFQRISACKSAKDSKKAVNGYLILQFILFVVLVPLLGLLGSVILPGDTKPDSVIVLLLEVVSHPLFSLFYTTLIISATLTTANSMLLSCSMSFSMNIVDALRKEPMDDAKKTFYGKIFIVVGGVLAFIVATFVPSVISLLMIAYTITSIVVVPLYMGLFTKIGGRMSAFASLLAGSISVLVLEIAKRPFGIHPILIALPLSFIVYMLFSAKDKPTAEQIALLDAAKTGK